MKQCKSIRPFLLLSDVLAGSLSQKSKTVGLGTTCAFCEALLIAKMSTALDKSPEYHSRSSSPLLDDQQDILTIFCCNYDDDKQFSSVNVDGHEVVPDDSESSKMPDQVTQAEDVRSLGQQNLVAVKADPRVIGKIEAIFEHVSQSLESGQDHVNLVLSPLSSRNDSFEHTDIDEDQPCKVISFPGKDGEEAWRFGK